MIELLKEEWNVAKKAGNASIREAYKELQEGKIIIFFKKGNKIRKIASYTLYLVDKGALLLIYILVIWHTQIFHPCTIQAPLFWTVEEIWGWISIRIWTCSSSLLRLNFVCDIHIACKFICLCGKENIYGFFPCVCCCYSEGN